MGMAARFIEYIIRGVGGMTRLASHQMRCVVLAVAGLQVAQAIAQAHRTSLQAAQAVTQAHRNQQ